MTRREILVLAAGVAALPLTATAQQPGRLRRVGALMPFPETDPVMRESVKAFGDALTHLGWTEGQNIGI
jgi:hypothetical protein